MPHHNAPHLRVAGLGRLGGRTLPLIEYWTFPNEGQGFRWFRPLWQVGASLFLLPAFIFAASTVWLMVGGTITQMVAVAILSFSVVGAIVVSGNRSPLTLIPFVVLCGLAILLNGFVHDTSIDGQQYHFQAVFAFTNGWNPYWGTSVPMIGDPVTLWAVHYPRATWLISATLLASGLPLSTVKAVNLLSGFAALALVGGALLRFGFSWPVAAILALGAVGSPILLSQLFTSMNDGLLGLCILLFVVSVAVGVHFRDSSALVVAVATLILGLNLKFSALPLFAVFAGFACLGTWWQKGARPAVSLAAIMSAAVLAAVMVFGWSPYMQNAMQFGHIFYPLMGSNAVDIMGGNTPKIFEPLSSEQRLLYSIFAETHAGYETNAALKWPFSVGYAELRAAGGVDVRIGGFGPLFSGVVVLAVVGAVALLSGPQRSYPPVAAFLLVAAALLVSIIIMPQNWWARYVPQLWFVPLCIAAALMVRGRAMQMLGLAIAALMIINAAMVGASGAWRAVDRSQYVSAQLKDWARTGQSYCIDPEMVQSRIYLMREAGIVARYTPRAELTCAEPEQIAGYGPDRSGGAACACP